MKEIILKIFRLQGLQRSLLHCQIDDQEIVLGLGDSRRAACPRCGRWSRHRHARGKVRRVFHGAGYGRRVYLQFRTGRYTCQVCGRPFSEQIDLIAPRQRRTQNAEQEILASLRGRSFKSVAVRDGLSYGTCQRILMRRVDPTQVPWPEEGPISLGIDGHSYRGTHLVNTITDVRSHRTLTILPDNRQKSLKAFLQNIPETVKNRIQEACIDMETAYLGAIQLALPNVSIVIDRFHIIQDANRRLDETRRIEQEGYRHPIPKILFMLGQEKLSPSKRSRRDQYLRLLPNLKDFYWMKEQLRGLYRLTSKTNAAKRLRDLIEIARISEDAAMNQWGRMLQRWGPFILNFFDSRTTNAFTEGTHTKIKMTKRVSFGFRNVQVYIRKALLCVWPLAIILPWLPH
jgi:transposase